MMDWERVRARNMVIYGLIRWLKTGPYPRRTERSIAMALGITINQVKSIQQEYADKASSLPGVTYWKVRAQMMIGDRCVHDFSMGDLSYLLNVDLSDITAGSVMRDD